ncbi:MAG: aspartate 1-decarboxylase [Bacteroidota bacterium]|nr:aspartate 1-decarboxylase [Candidatus Kapabacteria bacterium]MCX7936566.1 aspartate 1-decarboxylase [Chlorobiota bacterium]MDW8074759.1 aspartate 1-decarboxylase [Bacteroidota bacterium]
MRRIMFKSKVHRATITEANLHYEGSLTLDQALMEAADILPYEQVSVLNINNGERFETYVIPGERGSGVVCLNGAAARKGVVGDKVIILTYAEMTDEEAHRHTPTVVLVDDQNRVVEISADVYANRVIQ